MLRIAEVPMVKMTKLHAKLFRAASNNNGRTNAAF